MDNVTLTDMILTTLSPYAPLVWWLIGMISLFPVYIIIEEEDWKDIKVGTVIIYSLAACAGLLITAVAVIMLLVQLFKKMQPMLTLVWNTRLTGEKDDDS